MRKLDETKLARLHTAGELLEEKYGEVGTESRTAFHQQTIRGRIKNSTIYRYLQFPLIIGIFLLLPKS